MVTEQKGQILIVNLYDNRYWNIFLDGDLVVSPHKEEFTDYVLKKMCRKEWAEIAGVQESGLKYSLIDLYEYEGVIPDYDANDFDEYQDVINCCKTNSINYVFQNVDLAYIEKNY